MEGSPTLRFGCNRALPGGVTAAWGARAIFQNGRVDLLWDRQDIFGCAADTTDLSDWLNRGALSAARENANERVGWIDGINTLYEDERGVVKADPQRSYGYLYMAAWLKEHAPSTT